MFRNYYILYHCRINMINAKVPNLLYKYSFYIYMFGSKIYSWKEKLQKEGIKKKEDLWSSGDFVFKMLERKGLEIELPSPFSNGSYARGTFAEMGNNRQYFTDLRHRFSTWE